MFNGGTVAQGFLRRGRGCDRGGSSVERWGGHRMSGGAVRAGGCADGCDRDDLHHVDRASGVDAAGMGNRIRIGSGAVTTAKSRCWSWDTSFEGSWPRRVLVPWRAITFGIVKNFDVQGSNLAIANSAEKVSNPTDYNYVNARLGALRGRPQQRTPVGRRRRSGLMWTIPANGTVTNPADFTCSQLTSSGRTRAISRAPRIRQIEGNQVPRVTGKPSPRDTGIARVRPDEVAVNRLKSAGFVTVRCRYSPHQPERRRRPTGVRCCGAPPEPPPI